MQKLNEKNISFQEVAPDGTLTISAHPAKFSPEDPFSRERILNKKRFKIYYPDICTFKY